MMGQTPHNLFGIIRNLSDFPRPSSWLDLVWELNPLLREAFDAAIGRRKFRRPIAASSASRHAYSGQSER